MGRWWWWWCFFVVFLLAHAHTHFLPHVQHTHIHTHTLSRTLIHTHIYTQFTYTLYLLSSRGRGLSLFLHSPNPRGCRSVSSSGVGTAPSVGLPLLTEELRWSEVSTWTFHRIVSAWVAAGSVVPRPRSVSAHSATRRWLFRRLLPRPLRLPLLRSLLQRTKRHRRFWTVDSPRW
jgi:hypothetical protein